ncbi:hypothetical protein ACF0H5_012610 [Mactra antiquata]
MLLIMMCLFGTSAFSCVNCGLVFGRKMEGFLLKRMARLALNDCVNECRRRASCLCLNYNRLENLCELNSMPSPTLSSLIVEKKWVFYDVKGINSAFDIGNCNNHACMAGQVCVDTNVGYDCVNEGTHPSSIHLEHGIVKGNMNNDGSKIVFECIPPYVRNGPRLSSLSSDTGWSDIPLCQLTCPIPSFITSSIIQLLMATMITDNGNMIYTKETVNATTQLAKVFENSNIVLKCTTALYGTVSINIRCYNHNWVFSPGCTVADTSCKLETSCSNSVNENCISNLCRCDVSTSYSYTQHACVSTCHNGSANTFTRYDGIGIDDNDYDLYPDISLNECFDICVQSSNCLVFEYGDYNGLACFIRNLDFEEYVNNLDTWQTGATFLRDCL